MGWARLDDGYAMHPKLVQAGLEATGLDARAISHCAKYETDGFVADAEVSMLAGDAKKGAALAQRLAAVRRWERDEERKGYWVHDYLDYNKSHEQLDAERKTDRSRKKSGRNPSGQPPESRRSPPGHQTESKPTPNGIRPAASHAPPVGAGGSASARPPSRPVLDKHRSSSSITGVGDEPAEEEEPLGRIDQACTIVAQRRLDRRLTKPELEPITDRPAWLARTAARERQRIAADPALVEELGLLADAGEDLERLADLIDPPERPAASPYPEIGNQPAPAFEEVQTETGEWVTVRVGA